MIERFPTHVLPKRSNFPFYSGIKIFDIEKLNRVAHIDRPSGARASLYPHISDLRPKLLFERSDSLLICWGDCLMNMIIIHSKDADINAAKRISVKCEMAWELDCVGCDVQSIDAEFVAVLGLTSKTVQNDTEDDEEQNKWYSVFIRNQDNELEKLRCENLMLKDK